MRTIYTSLLCVLAGGGPVLAQPPAPSDPQLDAILAGWEKTMGGVKGMVAQCTRTRLDKTFGKTEVYEGQAKFLRSGVPGQPSRAVLHLQLKGKPEIFEKYVCTGTFLYEYRPGNKVIAVHEMPAPKPGQVSDDNILGFIFGMKAVDAKARYDLANDAPPTPDKFYHYVKVLPKFPADKAEFSLARLVLLQSDYLPRQFWFRQPNGDEITWDFPRVVNGSPVAATEFEMPALPTGWQWERQDKVAPRVLRNNEK